MHRTSRIFKLVLFGLLGWMVTGCVSTEVTSNKMEGYDKEITHLHVATQVSSLQEVGRAMRERFRFTFAGQGVPLDTSSLRRSEVASDSADGLASVRDLISSMDAPDASHILLVSTRSEETITRDTGQTMPGTGGAGGAGGVPVMTSKDVYLFDASLYDTQTQERVWRGEVTTEGDLNLIDTRTGNDIVETLIIELRDAGLLPERFQTTKEQGELELSRPDDQG